MTPEERKAFGEKMRLAREKKAQTTPPVETTSQDTPPTSETSPTVQIPVDTLNKLMERLDRLESHKTESLPGNHTPEINNMGRAVGVMQKYAVDVRDYDDPRQELYDLPELTRYAFKENYYLMWDVEAVQYENKWGIAYSEPRFVLKLYKRMFEDDGTPTPLMDKVTGKQIVDEQGRPQFRSYLVQRAYFFEDPIASMKEAQEMGIPVTNANSKDFLEKMRKLRYRNWLIEIFQPKRPTVQPRTTETVLVGSTQVQVESYSELA